MTDATNNMQETLDRVKRDALDLTDALLQITNQSVEDLNRVVQSMRELAENYYSQCVQHTREKPLASILQWAEVGFLIGWLLGGKNIRAQPREK